MSEKGFSSPKLHGSANVTIWPTASGVRRDDCVSTMQEDRASNLALLPY
jgi:hypothetical protein